MSTRVVSRLVLLGTLCTISMLSGAAVLGCGVEAASDLTVQVAAPAPDATRPLYFVWSLDEAGVPTTWMLEAMDAAGAEEASYRVLGRRQELWLAATGRVWRWRLEHQAFPTVSCGLEDDDELAGTCKSVRPRATLEPVFGGRVLSVYEPGADGDSVVGGVDEVVAPMTSIGPYLFVSQKAAWFPCGAHGSDERSQIVVDLARGEVLPRPDVLTDELPLAAALKKLQAKRDPAFDVDSLALSAIHPSYKGGHLGVSYQITADTCYACSDGAWSSYTVSTHIPASDLPPKLAGYAELPPTLAEFIREQGPMAGSSWGWSEATLDVPERAALGVMFKASENDPTLAAAGPDPLARG